MNSLKRARMDRLEELAQRDLEYIHLSAQMRDMENAYNQALHQLSDEDRDTVCGFVSQYEEMSWRILELACAHMHFPDEI